LLLPRGIAPLSISKIPQLDMPCLVQKGAVAAGLIDAVAQSGKMEAVPTEALVNNDLDALALRYAEAEAEILECTKERRIVVTCKHRDPRDTALGGCVELVHEPGTMRWIRRGKNVSLKTWDAWWLESRGAKKVVWHSRHGAGFGTREDPIKVSRLGLEGDAEDCTRRVLGFRARSAGYRFSMKEEVAQRFDSPTTRLVQISHGGKHDAFVLRPYMDVELVCVQLLEGLCAAAQDLRIGVVGSDVECMRLVCGEQPDSGTTWLHPFTNQAAFETDVRKSLCRDFSRIHDNGAPVECASVHNHDDAVQKLKTASKGHIVLHACHRFDGAACLALAKVFRALGDTRNYTVEATCVPAAHAQSALLGPRPLLEALFDDRFQSRRRCVLPSGTDQLVVTARVGRCGVQQLIDSKVLIPATAEIDTKSVCGLDVVVTLPDKTHRATKRRRDTEASRAADLLVDKSTPVKQIESMYFHEDCRAAIVITAKVDSRDICAVLARMPYKNPILFIEHGHGAVVDYTGSVHGSVIFV